LILSELISLRSYTETKFQTNYLGIPEFHSRPEGRLSWLRSFVVFLSPL